MKSSKNRNSCTLWRPHKNSNYNMNIVCTVHGRNHPPPQICFHPVFFPEICHCGGFVNLVQQIILKKWYLQGFHAVKALKP